MGKSIDMTLTLRHKILIGIGAAILLGLTIYLTRDVWTPLPENISYREKNFSFVYPREYRVEEYNRGAVSIGIKQDNSFSPFVEVVRYENDHDAALPSTFDVYIKRQAEALCGSDGPVENLTCSDAVSVPYTSAQGLEGQELSLTLLRTNLESGTTTTETYGPVYVFNVTQPVEDPEDTFRYRAIFVYPSFSSAASGNANFELLAQTIDSLLLPNGVSTTTSR